MLAPRPRKSRCLRNSQRPEGQGQGQGKEAVPSIRKRKGAKGKSKGKSKGRTTEAMGWTWRADRCLLSSGRFVDAIAVDVMKKKTPSPRCRLNHVEWGAELLVRRSKVEVRSSKLEGRSSKLILTFPIPVASIRHVSAAKNSVIKMYSSAIKKVSLLHGRAFFSVSTFRWSKIESRSKVVIKSQLLVAIRVQFFNILSWFTSVIKCGKQYVEQWWWSFGNS